MKQNILSSMWFKAFVTILSFMVIPIIALTSIAQKTNMQTSLQQKQISDLAALESFSNTLSIYLNGIENLGNSIVNNPDIQEYFEKNNNIAEEKGKSYYLQIDSSSTFNTLIEKEPSIVSYSFLDKDGYLIGEQLLDRNRLNWFFNPSFFEELDRTSANWSPTFTISNPNNQEKQNVFSMLYPCNKSSNFLGYIVLYIDINYLNEILSGFTDDIYILENSNIIASKNNVPFRTNLFQFNKINYSFLTNDSSVIVTTSSTPLIITTQLYDRLNFSIISISSYEKLVRDVAASSPNLFAYATFGIIFAIVSAFLIAQMISRPIRSLEKVMNRVSDGDLDTRFRPYTRDEVSRLGITFNTLLDTIQNLMVRERNQQKQQQHLQLQVVQEQIKPHFLYNILETISGMISCNKKEDAITTIQNLAQFYRMSLNNGKDIIPISDEILLTQNYLNMQHKRYIEFMDYVLAISPAIYRYSIPKLTLQPLIENAIYHGLKENCQKGIVCISGYLENNRIVFEIYDNGCGIEEHLLKELADNMHEEATTLPHFGLSSVIKRLNIYSNNNATLNIDSQLNEYTCVTISFPAKEDS